MVTQRLSSQKCFKGSTAHAGSHKRQHRQHPCHQSHLHLPQCRRQRLSMGLSLPATGLGKPRSSSHSRSRCSSKHSCCRRRRGTFGLAATSPTPPLASASQLHGLQGMRPPSPFRSSRARPKQRASASATRHEQTLPSPRSSYRQTPPQSKRAWRQTAKRCWRRSVCRSRRSAS